MNQDTLSELLGAVRLRGAVFFDLHARAPWVAAAPPAKVMAPSILPGLEHVIEYHVVLEGACWAGLVDEAPVRLQTGDVIIFPQGDAHVVSSAPGMRGDPDPGVLRAVEAGPLPVPVHLERGDGERTHVACGFLGCDARPFNPLLSALPRVIHLRRGQDADGTIPDLVRLAVAESTERRTGGGAVLSRLSELLFVECVRRHLAALPVGQLGWLAGLRDEGVGKALARIHASPTRAWTLERLAREAGMSRSVLAERFNLLVGVPPMQYLAQWRMQLASSLLTETTAGLAEIAERVGYGSEAALSRAYKRWMGMAPADWRRARRATP